MALEIQISGVARAALTNSLSITLRTDGRNTCEFTVLGGTQPVPGNEVAVFVSAVREFGGTLEEVVRYNFDNATSGTVAYRCAAVSWEQRLDERRVIPATSVTEPSTTFRSWAGTCDTSGTAVTWISGDLFDKNYAGSKIVIDSVTYTVSSVADTETLTLSTSAGTQSAVDWTWTPTAGNIVRSIISNWANDENITLTNVEDGETLDKRVYDYESVSEVLTELAERTNKIWYLGPDLELYFTARATVAAPTAITVSNALRDNCEVLASRQDKLNHSCRRISWTSFPPTENTFVGDDTTQEWYLETAPLAIVSISHQVPGEVREATIGVRGQDTGRDFYWSYGERRLTQEAATSEAVTDATNASPIVITLGAATTLADGHLVTIAGVLGNTAANGTWRISAVSGGGTVLELDGSTGNGAYTGSGTLTANSAPTVDDVIGVVYWRVGGDVVEYVDATAIASQAAVEGTSGKYIGLEEQSDYFGQVESLALQAARVEQQKADDTIFSFVTDVTGYRAGQLLTATNSTLGLSSSQLLITEVTARDIDGVFLRYTLKAIDGTRFGSWVDYFASRSDLASGRVVQGPPSGGTGSSGAADGVPVFIRVIDSRGSLVVGTDLADNHHTIRVESGKRIRLNSASVQVKTAATGASIIVDWQRSTDNGATWTSIFPSGNANKIVLAATLARASIATFASTPLYLERNDLLRYDVLQIGSGDAGGKLETVLAGEVV